MNLSRQFAREFYLYARIMSLRASSGAQKRPRKGFGPPKTIFIFKWNFIDKNISNFIIYCLYRDLLSNRFWLLHGLCLPLVPHSPSPITFALARALKHPVISLKNLAPIPAALISHRAIATWTYATYTPTLSLSIKALDSQFPLIVDKRRDIAAMTLQDYLKKNSQI